MMKMSVFALLTTALVNTEGCKPRDVVPKDRGNVVTRIVKELSNSSGLIILFDKKNEKLASAVSNMKGVNRLFLKSYVDNTRSFLHQHLDHVLVTATSVDDFRENLMLLVVCSDCLGHVVSEASEADKAVGQQTLRHFSTWLFITQNTALELETSFDNIAWMRFKDMDSPDAEETLFTTYQNVSTLLWMPEGRTWSEVLLSDVEDEDIFHQIFPNIKRGLNGRCLKIVTLEWIPQTIRNVVNGTVVYVGASIEYIHFLSQVFNFTYRMVEPEDGIWGSGMENGSWTGVVGMIQREEADFTGCVYAISASRAEVMDFTPSIYTAEFVVIYARVRSSLYFWKFLLSGLSWEVYLCSAAVFLCGMMIYMYILYVVDWNGTDQSRPTRMEIFFTFVGVSVRQDIPPVVQLGSSSERVIIFSWAFLCLLMTAIYSGSLVATATVDKFKVPFATLQELADQNEYTVSSYEGILALHVMKNSKHATYQQLYEKAKRHIMSTSGTYLDDGLHRILKERYAVIVNEQSYWAMRANSCEIHLMRERLFSTSASFGFPRRSPLVKLFHDTCRWMLDTGLAEKKQKQWLSALKPCEQKSGVVKNQFTLKHFKSLFVACISGIILGAVTLVVEKLRY